MRFLKKVSNAMQRFANKKYIIPLLLMFILIALTMEKGPVSSSSLKELSGGAGMLDMNFGYNRQQVYSMLQSIGQIGRQLYTKLLGIDFIFAIVFMLFQSLMLTSLLKRAEARESFRILNLLPFLRSGLDIIENCFILTIIFNYPVQMPIAVEISSVFTILKWVIYALIIATLFTLGALTSRKAINSRLRKSVKYREV